MAELYSQTLDDVAAFERIEAFSGGEDSYRRPTLLDPDQSQLLLNVLIRDNYEARTRPGIGAIGGAAVDAGFVRSLAFFSKPDVGGTVEQILASVDTILATNEQNIWKATAVSPEVITWTKLTGYKPTYGSRPAMMQGVDTVLIADGVQNMRSYDGAAFTDLGSNPQSGPPVTANILAWHTLRAFAAGMPLFPDTIFVSNILAFGSGDWDATTRSFRVGAGDGDPIVALASMQQYQLAVLKRNSIWLTDTDPQKQPANWSTDQGTGKISKGCGCVGRDAWCAYENDILYFSPQGMRSIQRMQAAAGQWRLQTPMSRPIQPYIDRINKAAWDKIVMETYEELVLIHVPFDQATKNTHTLVWNGLLVQPDGQPGRWLGMWEIAAQSSVITRFGGVNRLVIGDAIGQVNLWKDQSSNTDDATYLDNGAGYGTKTWMRSMTFGDMVADKDGDTAEIRMTAGNAIVSLTWCCDLADKKVWVGQPAPTGSALDGDDTLSGDGFDGTFVLESVSPLTIKQGIRGLGQFNEAFLKIESNTGWYWLRNVTVAAFVNPYL